MRALWLAVVVVVAGCGKEPNCAGMTVTGRKLAGSGEHGELVEAAIAACKRSEYFEERTDCAAAAACLEAYFGCLHGTYAQCPAGPPPARTEAQRPPALPFEEPRAPVRPPPAPADAATGSAPPPTPANNGLD